MKKILYGIIVLLGIGFISTNFIVGTDKLDHKVAKAGGTACKWISDTGLGLGPLQYNNNTDSISGNVGTHEIYSRSIRMVKCTNDNVGSELDAEVLLSFDDLTKRYTGYIYSNERYSNQAYVKFENGIPVECRECSTYSSGTCKSYNTRSCANFFFGSRYYLAGNYFEYDSDVINSLPTKYTCVCAEY